MEWANHLITWTHQSPFEKVSKNCKIQIHQHKITILNHKLDSNELPIKHFSGFMPESCQNGTCHRWSYTKLFLNVVQKYLFIENRLPGMNKYIHCEKLACKLSSADFIQQIINSSRIVQSYREASFRCPATFSSEKTFKIFLERLRHHTYSNLPLISKVLLPRLEFI